MSTPPTLEQLAADGVTEANVWCKCGHTGRVRFDRFPPTTEFPDIIKRIRCTQCKRRPSQVMPAWEMRTPSGMG